MKYIVLLLIPFTVMAQVVVTPPAERPPEKMYYHDKGWFGPWPETAIGVLTVNGEIECEATIIEDGVPIPRKWLKLEANGKVKCPVEVDTAKKALDLVEIQTKINNRGKSQAAKDRIKLRNCEAETGFMKDICEYIQGI